MTLYRSLAILGSFLLLGLSPLQGAAPRSPSRPMLRSAAALVLDQETGQPLVEKQVDAVRPIASITKLMTAMVVLDAKLDLSAPVVIESQDKDMIRHSRSRLPVGTHLTRAEAMGLALMSSENRAAHALARSFPGGVEACVAAMDAKARALGLSETHFEDPAGLSCGNVSSAMDLAKLVEAAYQYPLIRKYTTRPEATIESGRRLLQFINTNALVRGGRWQIGLSKTGFIQEAGQCLVMQAMLAERPVLIVLLDSWGKYTRLGDANRIRQWLEARFRRND
ncbi:MAG TPA: serine hydrolase [Holophagaceae bacterium]